PEVPKYGGEFVGCAAEAPYTFDDCYGAPSDGILLQATNERLVAGDWAKGPAGSNEYDFMVSGFLIMPTTGYLAESWEVPDDNTFIFHIRKGAHFALNPQSEASRLVGGREMTAEDVAFSITRQYKDVPKAYGATNTHGWFQSATVPDKYTVVVKGDSEAWPTTNTFVRMVNQVHIVPPEVVKKYGDMRDWRVSCGTGAWMLVDYMPGSSAKLIKNPNYWMYDPLHPENQLPYMDEQTWLFIKDRSTRMAALRTGKVDRIAQMKDDAGLSPEEMGSLLRSNPDLQSAPCITQRSTISMRVDRPELPFHDTRVRQALAMGIDRQAILRDYYQGQGELITWPSAPAFAPDGFTPYEKLPPDIKELFDYQPEKAKSLLAEAGYPNGFKTSVICSNNENEIDLLSIVTDYWSKIGVDLTLDVKESAVFTSIQKAKTHEEMLYYAPTVGSALILVTLQPGHRRNTCMCDDPYINERFEQIWATENIDNRRKRYNALNEVHLYALEQTFCIGLPSNQIYTVWQPWVQNYHGELTVGYGAYTNFTNYIWLDQDMKKQMTGK
ncbi:ABC transporter substrate-binding protein, partial [Chloroflexota bacterium]